MHERIDCIISMSQIFKTLDNNFYFFSWVITVTHIKHMQKDRGKIYFF